MVELIPGAVRVEVYGVELPPALNAQAWLLITRGLAAVGQREMIVAVRRRPGDARPPDFPFVLFRLVHQFASDGTTVDTGGFTQLRGPIVPGSPIAGFCYEDAGSRHLKSVGIAEPGPEPLLVVPLLAGEIDVAVRFGAARVLALLGAEYRYYPYPWWFDPDRRSVIDTPRYFGSTSLRHTAIVHVPDLQVVLFGTRLEIALPLSKCEWLHQLVAGVAQPITLLCAIARDWPSRLTWRPGQERREAIWDPSSTAFDAIPGDLAVAGNFCMFLHGDIDPGAQILEDGFALMLTEEQWTAVLSAIKNGRPLVWEHPASNDIREVILHYPRSDYPSPFGVKYNTSGVFRTYRPQPTEARPEPPVLRPNARIDSIMLLTDQKLVESAVEINDFVDAVRDIERAIDDELDGIACYNSKAVVQVTLVPDRQPEVHLVVERDAFPPEVGRRLVERLNRLPLVSVRNHPVRFEVHLSFGQGPVAD